MGLPGSVALETKSCETKTSSKEMFAWKFISNVPFRQTEKRYQKEDSLWGMQSVEIHAKITTSFPAKNH